MKPASRDRADVRKRVDVRLRAIENRIWKIPAFPLPELPDHVKRNLEDQNRWRPGFDTNGVAYIAEVLQCNGTKAKRAVVEGLSLHQADRWAAYHKQHPASIWGRLWWDIAALDARIMLGWQGVADQVLAFEAVRLSPSFTAAVRAVAA